MTILQSSKDKINKRAFERFVKSQKDSQFKQELENKIAKGDLTYSHDSFRLIKDWSSCLNPKNTPSGIRQFSLKQAASRSEFTSDEKAARSALVLPAKSLGRFLEEIDQETGEIQRLTVEKRTKELVPVFDESEHLINRYVLQSEARNILKSETKLNESGRPVPVYRVCDCLRNQASGSRGVRIVGSKLNEKARFTGLQTCGSVWHCPICSARISEVRRRQIREMVDIWQKSGKGVIFITNTIRHDRNDDLRLMLANLLDIVWHRYITHRAYKKLRKDLGYIGRVRSIEVTYGENGWHPHIHEIWLIDKDLTLAELKKIQVKLFKVWNVTLINAGMSPVTAARGVTVQNGSKAADYISKYGHEPKWDIGRELTQGHSKKSNGKGRTPFDLLRDSVLGDKQAAALFKEYAIAFAGKRQLYFSTGLKDFFMLDYKTDEEIASTAEFDTVQLAYIDSDSWRLILAFGSRPQLLLIAQSGGSYAVHEYVRGLRAKSKLLQHNFISLNT